MRPQLPVRKEATQLVLVVGRMSGVQLRLALFAPFLCVPLSPPLLLLSLAWSLAATCESNRVAVRSACSTSLSPTGS